MAEEYEATDDDEYEIDFRLVPNLFKEGLKPPHERRKDPAMGVLGYERDPREFYPTPVWCTEALIRNYPFSKDLPIDEPACGMGHISKVFEGKGFSVRSTDLNDLGFGEPGVDFLNTFFDRDQIVTNPPYNKNFPVKFALHGLVVTKNKGGFVALLMRTDWSAAAGRTKLLQHPAFAMKLELTRRPRWIEGSTGSARHNYAWFLWDWRTVGEPPTIKWDQ